MDFTFSRAGKAFVVGLGVLAMAACNGTTTGGGSNDGGGGSGTGGSGSGGGGAGGPLAKADKVDIVLMVDNSRSMADKQQVLSLALNDLVAALTNPPCVDPTGAQPPQQPASPEDACPAGLVRRHLPIEDIHLGVLSSSLGGHGADVCTTGTPDMASNNDKGHLIARTDPTQVDDIPTYESKGFLAWDPGAKYSPPGESDPAALVQKFAQMVQGVGQIGCGYESQMESWYRFLADPEPHETISVVNGVATPQGIDVALLQQRADFLRPDSMLVILTLTDENDCSIREAGQFYFAAQVANPNGSKFHLPRPRSECAVNPNDPCCKSCGQPAGECPEDLSCYVNNDPSQGLDMLEDVEDHLNVRCHDQKRRFGIDFLYPVDRYVQALTSPTVTTRAGDVVPNPIFSDLNPSDANTTIRDPGLVVMAGIVGVPWQDIARDPANPALGFKSAEELSQSGTWDVILGDPANYVAPSSPYMVESIDQRAGVDPGNPVNGADYTIAQRNDLQYACTFDLPAGAERDCSVPGTAACDCEPGTDNPLCAVDPATGLSTSLQVKAKAYPGLRELSVLKGLGPQGVAASICPVQLDDATSADFGYRPAIQGLLDRMAPRL